METVHYFRTMSVSPRFKPLRILLPALFALAAPDAFGAGKLAILPAEIALNGSSTHQALVVEIESDGQFTGEVTKNAALVSSDPAVVKLESGMAVAVKDGEATITATVDGQTVKAPLKVSGLGK